MTRKPHASAPSYVRERRNAAAVMRRAEKREGQRMKQTIAIPAGTTILIGQGDDEGVPMEVIEGSVTIDAGWSVVGGEVRASYPPGEALVPVARASTVSFDMDLTDYGRTFFTGLLDDAWRRDWYRSPGGWWES